MKSFVRCDVLLCLVLLLAGTTHGLKCRTTQEIQENGDFEYVVRMCLRHMRNESDLMGQFFNGDRYASIRNNRPRENMFYSNDDDYGRDGNSKYHIENGYHTNRNQNSGFPEGFEGVWSFGNQNNNDNNAQIDRNKYWDDGQRTRDGDYSDDFEYFGSQRNGKDGRKVYKTRTTYPHSYRQQIQYDRDMMNNYGNRESPNYSYSNRNKSTKLFFNREKNGDSPLADIEPCVIHCIFQEMKMVGDDGKPSKELISQRMLQKIRNPELKTFIQDSIEECFEGLDRRDHVSYDGSGRYRRRKSEWQCEWAKSFALCLEDKGRDNCDDWNEPTQGDSNGNGNNNRNSRDQKNKSNQNDRG